MVDIHNTLSSYVVAAHWLLLSMKQTTAVWILYRNQACYKTHAACTGLFTSVLSTQHVFGERCYWAFAGFTQKLSPFDNNFNYSLHTSFSHLHMAPLFLCIVFNCDAVKKTHYILNYTFVIVLKLCNWRWYRGKWNYKGGGVKNYSFVLHPYEKF